MTTVNPIEVTIRVAEENGMLVARTRFENRGTEPVLVMRGPNGYGERAKRPDAAPDFLMDPEFDIVCNGEHLRYVGPRTKWRAPRITDFDPLQPGEVVDIRRIRLDNAYRFGSGPQDCQLLHTHLQFDRVLNHMVAVPSLPAKFTYSPN